MIEGFKRTLTVALLLVGIAGLACVDMSAPKGPASISLLQLPALYIVKGDVMRDTNGVAGVPSLIAYDSHGTSSPVPDAQFIFTDSADIATFASNGQIRGDSIGIAHLIGQIGGLQTPAVSIAVTIAPTRMTKPIPDTTLGVPGGRDSASSLGTMVLGVTVTGGAGADTAIQGVIVNFTLAPHSTTTTYPAVFLTDDMGALSTVDTTDASGIASRTLGVFSIALDPAVLKGAPDSAIVTATAKYKGAIIGGAPIVFKIPLKVVF